MYDFLVLGAGSGGVRFARMLGSTGKKVGIVEKQDIGGTCVLRGCIPKKMLIYASSFGKDTDIATSYGWSGRLHDFQLWSFMLKKESELKRLSDIYTNILKNNNVDIIKGEAKFINTNTILVNEHEYKAKNFLVATGSIPKKLNIPGFEFTLDSSDFLSLKTLPKEVLILGGGYIAIEFSNILLSLGVTVNLYVRSGVPLRVFDRSVSAFIKDQLHYQGAKFIDGDSIKSIDKTKKGSFKVTFLSGKKLEVDMVINAIGREPNIRNLNLEAAKIEYDGSTKAIKVNDFFQTSSPNIYALGDVIDKVNLTPVATKQAMYLVSNLNNVNPKPFDYNFIPKTVFSYPEVASCGLTEQEARAQSYSIDIYLSIFKPLKFSLTNSQIKSMFKIIVEQNTQKVLGIHVVDINAGEIMQGFAAALKTGITKPQLDDVIGIHPTSAEELVTMYNKI